MVDPTLLVDETVEAVVQVDGKVRDRVEVSTAITADELVALALARPAVGARPVADREPDGRAPAAPGERRDGIRVDP